MSQGTTPTSPLTVPAIAPAAPGMSWLDRLFRFIFGMTSFAGLNRKRLLFIAFAAGLVVYAYFRHPWINWELEIIRLLPTYTPLGPNTLSQFIIVTQHALAPFFHWDILSMLIVLALPFWISFKVSSVYLADIFNIFEIKDQRIADRFIRQAAFASPAFQKIRIKGGMVEEKDTKSPIVRIGGPGNALVDLDSAALFEKIDGTSHVVGPTTDLPDNSYVLHGFERLRATIDLRDQTFSLGDVTSRTSDGIRVTIKNVRLLSSILRDAHPLPTSRKKIKENLHRPYPFTHSAVLKMVYDQAGDRDVVATQTKIAVRMELQDFISQHSLGEVLSPIGQPEINQQIDLELQYNPDPQPFNAPPFVPRPQLSSLFYEDFKGKFVDRAKSNRGIQLEWIDVGTWHLPAQIIPEKYLEAWRLTNENLARRNQQVLNEVRHQSTIRNLAGLIHAPVVQAIDLIDKNIPADELVYNLVGAYQARLRLTVDSLASTGNNVPVEIERTIRIIDTYLNAYLSTRTHKL